jgi:TonB family protein
MWYLLFLSAALKGTAVLVAAWMAAILLRGRSAATRHLVWTAAFAALLALPLLSLSLPALRMPVPVPNFIIQTTALTPAITTPAVNPGQATTARAVPASSHRTDWGLTISLLWTAGAAAGLAHMLLGWVAMWRLRRKALPFHAGDLAALTAEFGVRRPVVVLETPSGAMPMTFGLFHPAVFLPADAAQWSDERRRLVLSHELAHIRRGDSTAHLLARTALSLYWWNPLAWVAWRAFLKERERATDDLVLNAGARASEYAGHLLEIARTMQSAPALGWAAVAMARPSQLEGRLVAILDSRVNRTAPRRASALIASLAAIALVVPFAALRAQDRTEQLPADVDATIRAAAAQRNHQMLEGAAKAAESLRQYDVAQKLLESSLAIRAEVSGEQSTAYGVGLLKLGDLERSRRNFTDAEAFYTKAVSVLGSRPEAGPALIDLGTAAMRKKETQQAIDYFQKAQIADPQHAGPALTWLAVVQDRQANSQEADSLFKQSLSLEDPNSAEAATTMELYGFFLQRQGRAEEAGAIRDQAAAIRKEQGAKAVTIRQASGSNVFRVGNGVTAPAVISKAEPEYTEEARLAKYQGTVVVSTEIGPDGVAQSMKVIRGLGLGLDEQAVKAISQWKFKPGTKDGQPVPVTATIEVNFRLI